MHIVPSLKLNYVKWQPYKCIKENTTLKKIQNIGREKTFILMSLAYILVAMSLLTI